MVIVNLLAAAMVLLITGISAETEKPQYPVPVPQWAKYPSENLTASPVLPAISPSDMPPIVCGQYKACEVQPSRDVILRSMPPVPKGVPYLYEVQRDDLEICVECLVDEVDAPRFFPLVGTARRHHCHYKCTVYFTETVTGEYPTPFQFKKRRVEVVYIDRDHLQMCEDGTER